MTAEPDALRLVQAALHDADEISARIVAGRYRGNLSDVECLRNHVRKLAALSAPAVQPAAGREELIRILRHNHVRHPSQMAFESTADAILAALAHPPTQASESGGVDHADIAARLHPDLFSSDERTAHRAASPYAVSIKRAEAVAEVGRVLAAAAALSAPQAAPDEGEGES